MESVAGFQEPKFDPVFLAKFRGGFHVFVCLGVFVAGVGHHDQEIVRCPLLAELGIIDQATEYRGAVLAAAE